MPAVEWGIGGVYACGEREGKAEGGEEWVDEVFVKGGGCAWWVGGGCLGGLCWWGGRGMVMGVGGKGLRGGE